MVSKITIIEDCSPFYVRLVFDELDSIIEFVRSKLDKLILRHKSSYSDKVFPIEISKQIISLLPKNFDFDFRLERVSVFETAPRKGCGIHKDGKDHRVSFNIPIEIHDDLCTTYWYDEDQFSDYAKNTLNEPLLVNMNGINGYSRNIHLNYKSMNKFNHSKSMVASPGEMILFNTDIFHSWYNRSSFSRKILTLRVNNPGAMYFDDAKKILNL
jgi:hypothetical protein